VLIGLTTEALFRRRARLEKLLERAAGSRRIGKWSGAHPASLRLIAKPSRAGKRSDAENDEPQDRACALSNPSSTISVTAAVLAAPRQRVDARL
jgi:hypothetical protein